MSKESNVYSQGGGGNTYEFEVQTALMIQFLIKGPVPGFENSHIESIRFQSGSFGYNTDDLLLNCVSDSWQSHRVLMQVKHTLTISEKNSDFQKVMKKTWMDFSNKSIFDELNDKIYLIKSYLTYDEKKHLKTLCNWAKVKKDASDFINEVNLIKAKKSYLELFRKTLIDNQGEIRTDEEMFTFFKCFDILELDFGEVSSTSKNSFLTVIEYTKQDTNPANQIWNNVFAFVSHVDNKGGSFDQSNIPHSLQKHFKSNYYQTIKQQLKEISRQNEEILSLIDDQIDNYSIPRTGYYEQLNDKLVSSNLILITGAPGSGKSAIAKQLSQITINSHNGFLLIIKADELGKGNLRDYFLKFQISIPVDEIFKLFPLHTSHYIYVDALEKLTEYEGIAFKQLLTTVISYPQIKLVASCREAEFPLLRLKYFSTYPLERIEVDILSKEELLNIGNELPLLSSLLQNKRLTSLLLYPKYLDFAYKAIKQSSVELNDVDEFEFIKILWEVIVENKINQNSQGLPGKRGSEFINIAVLRAKTMTPYVIPASPDLYALSELEKDGVIVKSKHNEAYAPAHDILEDWALIRHAEKIFQTKSEPISFFDALGTEPAMRRAYRLWTMQSLKAEIKQKISFFSKVLVTDTLKSYWQDEAIIALLYSPYLKNYLQDNNKVLQENECVLLIRLIHVMRTACREMGQVEFSLEKKFLPIGTCWNYIFDFINLNFNSLPHKHYDIVLQTINDWHFILHNEKIDFSLISAPAIIIRRLLEDHYILSANYYYKDEKVLLCLKLYFDCCGAITTEVAGFLKNSMNGQKAKDIDDLEVDEVRDWKLPRYNEQIIELALSGRYSTQLAKYIPETLLTIMKEEWFYKPPIRRKDEPDYRWLSRSLGHSGDHNIPFGISSEFKRNYFPASAYQTPIYWLLKYHTLPTINFIVELFNYSVEKFIQSDYATSDERDEILIYLPDGKTIKQHGSGGLWCMFRGTGIATPYLLQSVLMALEKFLLELASEGINKKTLFEEIIGLLISKSKTVSLTAVVASIAQAYPTIVGKWIVSLFSHQKIFYWDITRYNGDYRPLNMTPSRTEDYFFWHERDFSNKLSHRLKFNPGLKGFLVDYCFNTREYNKEIFSLLDKLKKKTKNNDWVWKKILSEIDIRNWKVTKTEQLEDTVQFQIEPIHTGKLKEKVQEMQQEADVFIKNSDGSHWLLMAKKEKRDVNITQWREITSEYFKLTEFNPMHHYPGMAAYLGVKFLWEVLTLEEKQWCYDTIISISSSLMQREISHDYLSISISPFDGDAVMEALPLLLEKQEINCDEHRVFLADVLFADVIYNTLWYKEFIAAFGKLNWDEEKIGVLNLWKSLLLFSSFAKENPARHHRQPTEEDVKKYSSQIENLRTRILDNNIEFDIQSIDFSSCSPWVILKAIKILPVKNCPKQCCDFLIRLVDVFIERHFAKSHKEKPNYEEDEKFSTELRIELEEKLAEIILWNGETIGKLILRQLVERYFDPKIINSKNLTAKSEIGQLVRRVLEYIIYKTDDALSDDKPAEQQLVITCFKLIWEEYFLICVEKGIYTDLLLLNIRWNKDAKHWKPLEEMVPFFNVVIHFLGKDFIPAVVNLLSHIGDKSLLPSGLGSLWESIQQTDYRENVLSIRDITQLVYRVYNNHLETLNDDLKTRQSYMELLDEMVKEGSSDAYWIREYMISFRKVP